MKLKQRPEDFKVEELTDVTAGDRGDFALYRLTKRGWTTTAAMEMVARRWKLERRRLAWGGLKDRHAETLQYFSVLRGPRRQLRQQGLAVDYLGQVPEAYQSHHIRANRFDITIRGVANEELSPALEKLAEVAHYGVPNYFDDQRFGSVVGGQFIARFMLLGQYEEALRMVLAAPYDHDRARAKQVRRLLSERWGDWSLLAAALPDSTERKIAQYLCGHPSDFRDAFALLPHAMRTIYLAAYQSHLWNRILARWLELHCRADQLALLHTDDGRLPVHRKLDPDQHRELRALSLPLPTARWQPTDDSRRVLVDAVLAGEHLTLADLRFKGHRAMFFSKGERQALSQPENLQAVPAIDENTPGQSSLRLRFILARGAYATLIVKRLMHMDRPSGSNP
jgi:tRNA pseudouridine13 synthase